MIRSGTLNLGLYLSKIWKTLPIHFRREQLKNLEPMRCRDVLQIRLVTLGGRSLSPPPLPTLSLLPGCRDSNLRIFFPGFVQRER